VVLARSKLAGSVVSDPFKALEKLRHNAYDAVLLDINLPGMSGIALCEEMRKLPQHESTPAIFVTGCSEFEPGARAIFKAGDDLISKPIMPVELTVKVIAHLLRRRLQAEAARA
jgi:DNA-binding response OmpR family regulator